jgi:hypothetical protein
MMTVHKGSCHCGAVNVALRTNKSVAELGSRSCQCSFCRAHGASWTSDPAGELNVHISGAVSRYRLGTGTAEFLVCQTCGVAPAVIWHSTKGLLSEVRVECLPERDALLVHRTPTDFGDEALEQRLARRSMNWTPAVVTFAQASPSE